MFKYENISNYFVRQEQQEAVHIDRAGGEAV